MTDGKHYGGYQYRNRRDKSHRGRNSIWGTIITAIAGTVIKDITSENSKIKKIVRKIIPPKQIEDKQNKKKLINAEYKVINNENNNEQNTKNEKKDKLEGKDEQ